MIAFITIYLIIGFVWGLFWELRGIISDNLMRFQLIFIWPITFIAWIVGLVIGIIQGFNKDDE